MSRAAWVLLTLSVPGAAVSPLLTSTSASATAAPTGRWTAATPDEMVDALFARARAGGDDGLAALVVAASLDERATLGHVREGLASIAASGSPLAGDARWIGLELTPSPPPPRWSSVGSIAYDVAPDADGIVKSFAILGPFQDTGGGLLRREGPEGGGERWNDASARYSWGVYDVAWRRTLPASSTARGVPLDLYLHPRTETCAYLASRVTVPAAQPVMLHVASTGAVRLIWDGADVAASEDVHARLVLDRMAARIDATAGDHLVALKVCSGAVADDGRVRLRFSDASGRPLPLATSSDLGPLKLGPSRPSGSSRAEPARAERVDPERAEDPGPPKKDRAKAKAKIEAKPAKDPPRSAVTEPAPAVRGRAARSKDPKNAPPPEAPPFDEAPAVPVAITPPRGVSVVPTALERALGKPLANAPTDQVLAAAVLRTSGGGDDARSPRAPGLLDRVAQAPDVSPDELALAGWISPFGANRSGWLNLARTRAEAAHDVAAASFAQRRLVAAHLASRYVDWAVATSREEPLASATDPEAALLRALVKKQLGGPGFGRSALDDLLAVDASLGGKTPESVLQEMIPLARSQPELRFKLAQRLAAVSPETRGPGYVEAFRYQGGAAMEVAAADALGEQTSVDGVMAIGRTLLDAGRNRWAREAFFLATRLGPNRAGAFSGLANAREAVFADETHSGAPASEPIGRAAENLVRAHDLEPSDASVKAEIAFRSGAPSGDGADGPSAGHATPAGDASDLSYLMKPEVFLKKGREHPYAKGSIVDRQLHWTRVVTYHADKRVSQLMHYSREIVIEPRTENDSYENVPAEGEENELIFARVHRKDGTVAQPEEQSSGGRRVMVRWPELKTGDVVEVAVRSWTAGPVGRRGDAPFWFIDYVGATDTHPILYNEVIVDSPESSPLAVDVLTPGSSGSPGPSQGNKTAKTTTTKKNGRVVTRFAWDDPPWVPDEPLAPKLSETLPVVVGSTFASWGDFREWYKAAVKGFTEPDDQVRRKALELTAGKKTREEKLQAIFEFVADDIRYVNYVSGEWWLPNRPQELLARRQGDCDDKAMLLITLLKAIGIQANEALVQTRYTGQPSLLRAEHAAIPLFDHGIAYLPGEKGKPGIWLDATSPESRLGPLPSMDARTVAFFIDEGPAKVVDTPASSPDEHGVDARWTIKLSPSGAGDLVAEERHSGDSAFELRMNLKQPDARNQWVEQYLASGWFPTVQVTGDIDFKTDLPKGVAILKYGAHSEGLGRREGDELAVPLAESSTLASQLAPLVKRTLPVVLPSRLAPGHETRTITIEAPEGYSFAELPPNGEVLGGEFGKARLDFKRGPKSSVVVTRSVVFDLATIPVEKYAKWRAWLQRVDGLMHRTVRLVPGHGKGGGAEKAKR